MQCADLVFVDDLRLFDRGEVLHDQADAGEVEQSWLDLFQGHSVIFYSLRRLAEKYNK